MIGQEEEECACCKLGMEEVERQELEWLKKVGWIAHVVADDDTPTGFNYHTHHIPDSWPGAMDIQIIAPLPQKIAHHLAWGYVDLLKQGKRFKSGDTVEKIIKGMPVAFAETTENGRKVLRMIVPDQQGCVDKAKMAKPYDCQWQGCSK